MSLLAYQVLNDHLISLPVSSQVRKQFVIIQCTVRIQTAAADSYVCIPLQDPHLHGLIRYCLIRYFVDHRPQDCKGAFDHSVRTMYRSGQAIFMPCSQAVHHLVKHRHLRGGTSQPVALIHNHYIPCIPELFQIHLAKGLDCGKCYMAANLGFSCRDCSQCFLWKILFCPGL